MNRLWLALCLLCLVMLFSSCEEKTEHLAPAIYPGDSVAMMISYGVNTLISDSGIVKYRIVTEKWEVNSNKNPARWIFEKGLFLEKYDNNFNVESYIKCDTAFYYNQKKIWELRGNVRVITKNKFRFTSQELFYDENEHEFYSNVFSKMITPNRCLQGNRFRSDDKMTKYFISNSKGAFSRDDITSSDLLSSDQNEGEQFIRNRQEPSKKTI